MKASDIQAATPKCPSFVSPGRESQRCALPMEWHDRRGVWVCRRHPHMQVLPLNDRADLAPAWVRDQVIAEVDDNSAR